MRSAQLFPFIHHGLPVALVTASTHRCELDLTRTVPRVTARFHDFAIIRGVRGAPAPLATAKGNAPMISLRKLLTAASIAVVAAVSTVSVSAPASAAGICDQQGRRVLIKGVWHKVVRNKQGRLIDCGAGNAF
jgi:hypothetical protein